MKNNDRINDNPGEDASTNAILISQVAAAIVRIIEHEFSDHKLAQLWTEKHRVLFRTADGRTGDVEVLVNWDVMRTESNENRRTQ